MNYCAIIAEFNPFHNGHEYLIKKAKELDMPVMCLMSGNFVQRGEPAILDKYSRAVCAINAGADMVCELPCFYAISSAHNFAYGAIKTLKNLNCKTLVIGAKYTNLDDYFALANIKSASIKKALHSELERGINYSSALINVLKTKYTGSPEIFDDASNILALEYITQIIEQKANINVVLVERLDGGYSSSHSVNNFANATLIRKNIENNNMNKIKTFVPQYSYDLLKNQINKKSINDILFYNLRNMSSKQLKNLYDYSEGLPYLIETQSKIATNYNEFITLCTSKRYKTTRIKKLALYASLNITKSLAKKIIKNNNPVKLLAIKKSIKNMLPEFNKNVINMIVSINDLKSLSQDELYSVNLDLLASNLYSIAANKNYNNDITTGTIFVE